MHDARQHYEDQVQPGGRETEHGVTGESSLPALAGQLAGYRPGVRRPAEVISAINAALADIERRGLVPGVEIGEIAARFVLPDAAGMPVALADRLAIGAYRIRFELPQTMKAHLLDTTRAALAKQQPGGAWSLPVPATFVLDPAGVVRARHVSVDYRTRMEPADALRCVEHILTDRCPSKISTRR